MYTLDNCKFKDVLAKKNSDSTDKYISVLKIIEKPSQELLECIKTNFPNYTDHTIQHSYRILNYIFNILSESMVDDLSAAEIFCLILSAMLHDVGMSNSTQKNKQVIREQHAGLSAKPIDILLEHLTFLPFITRIKKCVIYVCESHTKKLDQLYNEPAFKNKDTVNGEMVRYGYLAILLRIGDLMDIEGERTSYIVNEIYPEYYEIENSSSHHNRCEELNNYIYSNDMIEAHVEAKSRQNYKIWSSWFSYLKDEIIQANTYYLRDFVKVGSMPKFQYELRPAAGANFSTEEIRFEIDDKGALWKIISESVYTDEYDFLRELIQNAIDACLMDCYLNPKYVLDSSYQRKWSIEQYCVNVIFSEELNILIVYDNGIGMDRDALKKYLFKTADSGYKHMDIKREFLFPAIAKFGIGFVACLTKADSIKIITQGVHSDIQLIAEIEKDSNLAFIENIEKSECHGTAIELQLKDKHTYANIERYLIQIFRETVITVGSDPIKIM